MASKYLSWLIIPLIILLFVAHAWMYRNFLIDDPFISFRYIQQWINGNGLVYNIGERVEGYSNFLWIVVLTPFALAGIDLLTAAKATGFVLSLLTLVLTMVITRSWRFPFVAPLLLAVSAPFAVWSVGALETPLFTLLFLVCVVVFVHEEEQQKGWGSGSLFGLLALTRPEGLFIAGFTVLFRLWRLIVARSFPQRQDWLRAAGLLLLVAPYFLWRFSYYGYLLPNTVYAKSMGFHARAWVESFYYLGESLTIIGGFWGVALLLVFVIADRERSLLERYLLLNVVAYTLFIIIGGGDWMPLQRFLAHMLPLIFLLVHRGFIRLQAVLPGSRRLILVSLLVLGQAGYLLFLSLDKQLVEGVPGTVQERMNSPKIAYLQEHVEPGDTIALVNAGLVYHLPLEVRAVDMVGLTDEHIAHLSPVFPSGLFGQGDGFGKWDVDYVLAQHPRYVEGSRSTFTGSKLLEQDPRFQQRYRRISEPPGVGLYVRKTEPQEPGGTTRRQDDKTTRSVAQ
jgi:hypothetical protein